MENKYFLVSALGISLRNKLAPLTLIVLVCIGSMQQKTYAQSTLVTYTPTGSAATAVATGLTASPWNKNSLATTNASCTSNNFSATNLNDGSNSAAVGSQKYFSFSLTPNASTCSFTINKINVNGNEEDFRWIFK